MAALVSMFVAGAVAGGALVWFVLAYRAPRTPLIALLALTLCACASAPKRASAPGCFGKTNIEQFSDVQEAGCVPGIRSVEVFGDHELVTETITFAEEFVGRSLVAELTGFASDAYRTFKILSERYPMERFVWRLRDVAGRPMCLFEITEDETHGGCVPVVKD